MKKKRMNRRISIVFIVMILIWNTLPMVSMAGGAITPGQPITPGDAIAPGNPIQGGQFIVPGEVYDYGSSIQSSDGLNSGTPIIQGSAINGGQFITPNGLPSLNVIAGGVPIQAGTNIQAGNQVNAGSASSAGESVNSGNAVQGGNAVTGNATQGGNAVTGNATQGGNAVAGNATQGGNAVTGNATQGGNAVTGNATQGGNAISGNATQGGDAVSGNTTQGGDGVSGNATQGGDSVSGNSTNSDNIFTSIADVGKDVRRYVLNFGDNVAQGAVSIHAGFDFRDLGGGKYYSVYGKESLKTPIGNWFYDRYKTYTYEGEKSILGPKVRRIGEDRYNAFMQSKNIGGAGSLWSSAGKSVKSSLNNSWNVFNKGFYKLSNMLKMNGPVGLVLSSVDSVSKYSDGFKKWSGLASTEFAASLTTDVAIGATTTAVGSFAGSVVAGALAGSVVPGLGTIIGAVVGLVAGLVTTYLINGTPWGRKAKEWTTNTIKKGYDGVVKGARKAREGAKSAADTISNGISKIGGFLGFGG